MLQEDQVTSAPKAVRVSMRTAVYTSQKNFVSQQCDKSSEKRDAYLDGHVKTASNASTLQDEIVVSISGNIAMKL